MSSPLLRRPTFGPVCDTGSLIERIEKTTDDFSSHFGIEQNWPGVDIGPRVVAQGCICVESIIPVGDKSLWGTDPKIGTVQFDPKNKFWMLSLVKCGELTSRASYWTDNNIGSFFGNFFDAQGRLISSEVETPLDDEVVWGCIGDLITDPTTPRYVQKANKPFKFGG